MALTLRKIAIKDPESSDMVLLSNIIDGVDGAANIGWSQQTEAVRVEDNQTIEFSVNGELDIKVVRPSNADVSTLNGLIGEKVEISGYTISGFLIIRDSVRLVRVPDVNSSIHNDQIKVTVKAIKGYVEEA